MPKHKTPKEPMMQVTVRVPLALIRRADKLAKEKSGMAGLIVTRTDALRIALASGLTAEGV